MKIKLFLLIVNITLIVSTNAQKVTKSRGVPSIPTEIEYKQPDGSVVTILQRGDAVFHWNSSPDGYTIIKNSNKYFEYATTNSTKKLVSSGIRYQSGSLKSAQVQNFLGTAKKNVFYSKSQVDAAVSNSILLSTNSGTEVSKSFPKTGNRKLLTILANFSNTTPTFTQTNFNTYATNIASYYTENSYGALTLVTTVTAWVNLSKPHDYYGPESNWGEFAYDAIRAADAAGLDLSQFDNDGDGIVDGVAVIHQGNGQEASSNTNDIWSHSWDLSSAGYTASQRTFDGVRVNQYTTQPELLNSAMSTIGVFCHEFGHNLGLPDFYDTDYATNGQYDGTGNWDIMASGSWNGNPAGSRPAYHNIWSKSFLGWLTPTTLTSANSYTLKNSEQNKEGYKIKTTTPNEYFLLENRQQVGLDNSIPGHGMVIYHVDENYINSHMATNNINTTSHQGLHPESANGTINASSCPFPGSTSKTQFTDNTTPNSHSWIGSNTNFPITNISEASNTISFSTLASTIQAPTIQASNIVVTNITATSATISWANGNGAKRVVFVENPSATAQFPTNKTTYIASSDWNNKGSRLGTSNYYCVYNGAGNSVTLTNLPPNSQFAIRISEYNGTAGNEQCLISNVAGNPAVFNTLAAIQAPTIQASNIVVTNITATSATISWTKGNGLNRVVFVESPSSFAAAPTNNMTYTASSDWSSKGTRITTSNYYCVYNGSGSSVILTNLTPNSTFTVRISEYNGAASMEKYLTTIVGVVGNPAVFNTPVAIQAPTIQASNIVVTNITATSATVSWTNGNGAKRIVFVENPSATAQFPTNKTTYVASSDWNNKGTRLGTSNYYCVYNGAGNSVTLTNLPSNSQFAIRISEYNGTAGNEQCLISNVAGNPYVFNTPVSTLKNVFENTQFEQYQNVNTTVSVFPNPTSGVTTVKSAKDGDDTMNISVSNLQGVVFYKVNTLQNSIDIDLTDVASGIYLVKIEIKGIVTICKVIKN